MAPESLCQLDHHSNSYQPKERRFDTSLTLELKPSSYTGPCKQLLEAPPLHGLYIRIYPITPGVDKSISSSTSWHDLHSLSGARSAKNMNVDSHNGGGGGNGGGVNGSGQKTNHNKNSTSTTGSCPLNIVSITDTNLSLSPINSDAIFIRIFNSRRYIDRQMQKRTLRVQQVYSKNGHPLYNM